MVVLSEVLQLPLRLNRVEPSTNHSHAAPMPFDDIVKNVDQDQGKNPTNVFWPTHLWSSCSSSLGNRNLIGVSLPLAIGLLLPLYPFPRVFGDVLGWERARIITSITQKKQNSSRNKPGFDVSFWCFQPSKSAVKSGCNMIHRDPPWPQPTSAASLACCACQNARFTTKNIGSPWWNR